jgi:nucleotide-binding universal stress UspA family protein
MIRSILLAVDASPWGKVAATYATFLCYKLDATLDAVYVMDSRLINMPYWADYGAISLPVTRFAGEMQELLRTQGTAVLAQVKENADKAGVSCRTELRTGIPAAQILEAAQDCDLIILGRRGESSRLEDAKGLGAVAERVLRSSKMPVILTDETYTELTRVLLGYDGSDRAREAMVYAAELAARLAIPMLAISVHDRLELAEERLNTVKVYAEAHDLDLTTLALQGDPVDAILNESADGDLIAIGAFGEGRVRAWLLGSTTEAILRGSVQPVLLHR